MKKNYLLFATTAMIMTGCASDDFIGDAPVSNGGEQAIGFNMNMPAITRALENEQAAAKLTNKFFVWGEKNEGDNSTTITNDVTAENTVFQNYTVYYGGESSANTTTSNTKGWEYVGLPSDTIVSNGNLAPVTPKPQYIKYWDKGATDYTFTAVSADAAAIKNGNVVIQKIKKANATNGTVYDKGYEITVKTLAAAGSVYVADRVNIKKPSSAFTKNDNENEYGGYVKFTFRNFRSKIRFGIYENVSGYKVIITKIVNGNNIYEAADGKRDFGVTSKFVEPGADTKYTVTYEPKVAQGETQKVDENTVKFTLDSSVAPVDYLNTGGTNWLDTKFTDWTTTSNTNKFIGETAATATYDKSAKDNDGNVTDSKVYTDILPNPSNAEDMTLQISYTLISEDTGEKIVVENKSVKVPHEYCQWKPNFAYTYLFKITDQSADLYPITFDACVVENETGKQETITTVTAPSITTFATATSNNVTTYVTEKNEYAATNTIYATVLENGNIVELTTANTANINLYTVTSDDETAYPITEASVANAVANSSVTGKIKTTSITIGDTNNDPKAELTNVVPTEDGNTITLTSGKVLKWTPTGATTYAVEYTTNGKKYYKIVKVVANQ